MTTLKDYINDDITKFLDDFQNIEEARENKELLIEEIMESVVAVFGKMTGI